MCYFGSLSEGITQIASGKAGPSGVVTYVLVGLTVFFMLAAVTWSTFVVRSASFDTLLWECESVGGRRGRKRFVGVFQGRFLGGVCASPGGRGGVSGGSTIWEACVQQSSVFCQVSFPESCMQLDWWPRGLQGLTGRCLQQLYKCMSVMSVIAG